MTIPTHDLNDGRTIPAIGFGTYPLRGEPGVDAIRSAIGVGYRLIDTAFYYDNEGTVGRAIAEERKAHAVDPANLVREGRPNRNAY